MKRILLAAGLLLSAVSMQACQGMTNSAPGAMPLGAISTSATYDVLPTAMGEAEGTTILGIFTIGLDGNAGAVGGGASGSLFDWVIPDNAVRAEAVYNALEASGDADALLFPRYHDDYTWYVLWSEHKAKVWGKPIKVNASAN